MLLKFSPWLYAKPLPIWRLKFALLVAIFLQLAGQAQAQTISFTGKDSPLKEIFSVIKQQTGYVVLYDMDVLKDTKPVTVTADHQPLAHFLNEVLKGQSLDFSIRKKTIFIKKASPGAVGDDHIRVIPLPANIKPVTGIIRNAAHEPVAGANIVIRGTSRGVAANADGTFTILASVNDLLVITAIGYESVEHKIDPQVDGVFVITMLRSETALGEVEVSVNTGYQRIRPEQSTGAVSTLTTKEYESQISTDFLDGLTNRLPGLMINNNVSFTSPNASGTATSRSLFSIRGISTMSANQNPLIVVDGYPTELTLDMIDPNEIKSVTVLKDAAAATIYGVRASNGVIVIERKQAAIGKPRVSFRLTSGITPKENYSRYKWDPDASTAVTNYEKATYATSVSSSTWAQLSATGSASRVPYPTAYYIMAQSAANVITPRQAAESFAALENYNDAKDYSRLFQQSALTQTANLNVSGGSENALYYITANYTGNRLENIKNDNNRLLLSGRTTLKFSNRLNLELTTDYQESHNTAAPVPNINSIYPYEHFQDVNGSPLPTAIGSGTNPYYNNYLMSLGLEDNLYYPLVDVNQVSDKTHTVNNRITANFQYKIGYGFDVTFGGIYETSRSDLRHFASELSSEAGQYINGYATQNPDGSINFNIPKGGFLRQETDNTSTYTGRAQLNYNKKLAGVHSINAIIGGEIRDLKQTSNVASYFGYNDQTLLQQPVDYADIVSGAIVGTFLHPLSINNSTYPNFFNQAYTDDRYLSGYGNLVYSYKNTYSLSGSMRIDQSNLFGTNPRYKYRPNWTVGAAWNINKEKFMEQVGWMDILKLRISDGFNGNVAKNSLPQVIAQSILNSYTSPASPALTLLSYANKSLRWEQTNSLNVGLDYRIFKHISGSFDVYKKKSTDLMGNAQIDPAIGASPSLINNASINNTGLEIGLHADWIATKKLNWNTGFILARNTSKVLKVYQNTSHSPDVANSLGYVQGYPTGALFAFRYAGLDTAGLPMLRDTKGALYHTSSASSAAGNQVATMMASDTSGLIRFMGSSIPTINAGLSNRVDIGSFYFYCMLNYYGGFKVIAPRPDPSALRPLKGASGYWKRPGDENSTNVMTLPGFTNYFSDVAYNYADRYVVNGDYISLSDITASYSLDRTRFIKHAGLSHAEIKLQATNIWTVGLNRYNYSLATGSFAKSYLTPTYTLAIFTNF